MDTSTGIEPNDGSDDGSDDDDDPAKWQRSPSPSSSVSHLAASFVQRVNAFVGGITPKSPGGPLTDAELEAEAERDRDRSRREAESILTKEAQKRKLVEERVLAMMETTKSLPPPPSRSQAVSNPPSPSNSQKESSWWSMAKNRLTPTKEPLTPAQQVISDAKAREKEKKGGKRKEEWPSNPQGKFNDPAFTNLNIPVAPPQRRPVPSSPSSPTPSRPSLSNMPPNLTPSPMRTVDSISSSPSREAPPIYAQFNAQGTLDVPGTLLAIAKRFEKLEKWTVGHVRALEDRMNDVEKWLVDKERAKAETASIEGETKDVPLQELQEIREEVSELQGRVGELGREMAKLATAPSNLSSGPKNQVASVSTAPQTISSVIVQQNTGTISPSTPHHPRLSSTTAMESTSPPMASTKTPSGTRLPYPQGDYTSPLDTFSPTNSPPGSINAAVRTRPMPIPGLPSTSTGLPSSTSTSYSSMSSVSSISSFGGRTLSPKPRTANISPTVTGTGSGTGLPPPKSATQRQTSISPTPRKRYTVALGGPIVAPNELSSNAAELPGRTPKSFAKPQSSIDGTLFSANGSSSRRGLGDQAEDVDLGGEETIGKSTAARLMTSGMGDYRATNPSSPPISNRRLRAQSAYGFSNIPGSNTMASGGGNSTVGSSGIPSVAPLKPRLRSKSSERLDSGGGTGDGMVSALGGTKFVDPLILRKQSRDSFKAIAMPKPIGKVPIGQLVAFFDGDKNSK